MRGPFWSFRPAPILLGEVLGAQFIATLIVVYGLFMASIGWTYVIYVWLYATAWFVFNNFLKVGVINPFRKRGFYI